MSFLTWLKSLFHRPRPVVRNVAELAMQTPGSDMAAVVEVVDTSGAPIKPSHRRRAIRDPRLLPKLKPTQTIWPRPKRPKYLDKAEANRLFSATQRTRNRQIRDLATDREQLERYGLPVWENEQQLADALGVPLGKLRHFSIHRQRETSPHYVTFAIPKRSGGERFIHAPKKQLKAIQRRLNDLLVKRLPSSSAAHGFRSGRSVVTNAAPHVAKAVVIKLDLKDCFPTIHFGRVRGLMIAMGYSYPVATTLAVLMTEAPRQPVEVEGKVFHVPVGPRTCVQGAPTSPGLCNAILCRLDRRLEGFARRQGFSYTRYADDLTFSGDDPEKIKRVLSIAARAVREEGFSINHDKTRVLRRSRCQRVTGVVVNQTTGLSRKERRRLRAAIHQYAQSPESKDAQANQRLAGKLAYLKMLNASQAAPLLAAFDQARRGG